MNPQNTIFMALEQEQEHKQQQFIITEFTCAYCKQTNYKSGFFTIVKEIGIQLFCSKKCADYEKKRKQELICAQCGKSFETLTQVNKRKYCSNICRTNGHYSKYKKFNWCDMCNEWIRKEDSIFKPAGTIIHHKKDKYKLKKDNQFCPICKNRLRVRKWGRKTNNRNDNTTRTGTTSEI